MDIFRKALPLILISVGFMMGAHTAVAATAFGFQQVTDQAKQLAAKPFEDVPDKLPDFLKDLDYDQWRDIRFKNARTLWKDDREPFKVRFFHLGFFYHRPVVINYIDGKGVHKFDFSPNLFDYGKNHFTATVPAYLGFAGFRLHYPINNPRYADEIAVFLGATYIRSLAKGQVYGLSARGLAVNMASPSGEEFPFFKEFWIVKPKPWAKQITVYALMDSQSVSGAYMFVITPGKVTRMHVRSVLFFRHAVTTLGVAPMTSMFFFGEMKEPQGQKDFRPEVHDSDGLFIVTRSHQQIWRPLINPPSLRVNTFNVGTPQGFGLWQRDTDFSHYQDLEARFDQRPSVWITPDNDWGAGHVELVQIPSNLEYNDNINAFWVPAKAPQAGDTREFSYTMQWCSPQTLSFKGGHAIATRAGEPNKDKIKFVIDFQGRQLQSLGASHHLTADIQVTRGYKISDSEVYKNKVTGGWRMIFKLSWDAQGPLKDILPDQRPAADLQAVIKDGHHILTETWTYTFQP